MFLFRKANSETASVFFWYIKISENRIVDHFNKLGKVATLGIAVLKVFYVGHKAKLRLFDGYGDLLWQ